jgi:hypothetical protein
MTMTAPETLPVTPQLPEQQYVLPKILENLLTDLNLKVHTANVIQNDIAVINKLIETIKTIEL